MKEASSTQLDLAAFCQAGKLSCAFHHAKCGCTTPLVGALLQLCSAPILLRFCSDSAPILLRFCSDSTLILLHSAVMLERAYYAEYSADIIRVCLPGDCSIICIYLPLRHVYCNAYNYVRLRTTHASYADHPGEVPTVPSKGPSRAPSELHCMTRS